MINHHNHRTGVNRTQLYKTDIAKKIRALIQKSRKSTVYHFRASVEVVVLRNW